jgi:hypothetical protein
VDDCLEIGETAGAVVGAQGQDLKAGCQGGIAGFIRRGVIADVHVRSPLDSSQAGPGRDPGNVGNAAVPQCHGADAGGEC